MGRADSVVGRQRGGKTPERSPASGPAVLAEAAAVGPMLERGGGVRWRIAAAPTGTGRDPVSSRCRQRHQRGRLADGLAGSGEQVRAAIHSLPPLKRQRQRQCRWAGLTGVSGTDFRCEGAADGLGVTVDCADSVAGRCRGGKASERPLGSGAALSVVAVAAVGMLGCGWVQWANGKCFCV